MIVSIHAAVEISVAVYIAHGEKKTQIQVSR